MTEDLKALSQKSKLRVIYGSASIQEAAALIRGYEAQIEWMERRLDCGHPVELAVISAESGEFLFCELCNSNSGHNDAVHMELTYKSEIASLTNKYEEAIHNVREDAAICIAERDAEIAELREQLGEVDSAIGNRLIFDNFSTRADKINHACKVAGESDKLRAQLKQCQEGK
jgi:hypothetical protein